MTKARIGYEIKAKGDRTAEVLIYDEIGGGWFGGVSAKDFASDLKAMGKLDQINVRINSPGGSVFDGVAIYNTLVKNRASVTVDIDGLAASIASIIAMAGDEIRMADNALFMIHNPWTMAMGGADDLRDSANLLDKIRDTLVTTYVARSSADEDTISSMMDAETWMTADEAKEAGFIDEVTSEMKMAAFDLTKFKNAPETLTNEPGQTGRPNFESVTEGIALRAAKLTRIK